MSAPGASLSTKAALRAELLRMRQGLQPPDVQAWSAAILERVAALEAFRRAGTVGLYAAQPGEVQTAELFRAAVDAGKQVVFPRVERGERVLHWRRVVLPDRDLAPRTLRLLEPLEHCPRVEPTQVELFIVPGVGFTAQGDRLGHGAGYYDATLAAAPAAFRVAVAFAHQVVPALPTEPHDVRMDWVVTQDAVHPGMLGTRG